MFGFFKKNNKNVEKTEEIVVEKQLEKEEYSIDIFSGEELPLSWTDKETGLIWEVKTESNYEDTFSFEEAKLYADSLNRHHYDKSGKWRVPTVDELLSLGSVHLFDYRNKSANFGSRVSWKSKYSEHRNGKLFVKKIFADFMNKQVESWYWTSEDVGAFSKGVNDKQVKRMTDTAWAINFFEGGNYHITKTEKQSLICVRNKASKF